MANEDKLKELLESVYNMPKDQILISMSNGNGGFNAVAMSPEQSCIVDLMLRGTSRQGAFIKTPIELNVKRNTTCDYCSGDAGMRLKNSYGNHCDVEVVESRLLFNCIEDDHSRFNMSISFCPFCGRILSE